MANRHLGESDKCRGIGRNYSVTAEIQGNDEEEEEEEDEDEDEEEPGHYEGFKQMSRTPMLDELNGLIWVPSRSRRFPVAVGCAVVASSPKPSRGAAGCIPFVLVCRFCPSW